MRERESPPGHPNCPSMVSARRGDSAVKAAEECRIWAFEDVPVTADEDGIVDASSPCFTQGRLIDGVREGFGDVIAVTPVEGNHLGTPGSLLGVVRPGKGVCPGRWLACPLGAARDDYLHRQVFEGIVLLDCQADSCFDHRKVQHGQI